MGLNQRKIFFKYQSKRQLVIIKDKRVRNDCECFHIMWRNLIGREWKGGKWPKVQILLTTTDGFGYTLPAIPTGHADEEALPLVMEIFPFFHGPLIWYAFPEKFTSSKQNPLGWSRTWFQPTGKNAFHRTFGFSAFGLRTSSWFNHIIQKLGPTRRVSSGCYWKKRKG